MGQVKSSAQKRSFLLFPLFLMLAVVGACQRTLPEPSALGPSPSPGWFANQKARWKEQVKPTDSALPAARTVAFSARSSRLAWLERKDNSTAFYTAEVRAETTPQLISERPVESGFFQVSLSPDGKNALLLREDPKSAVPREQAVLELWNFKTATSRTVSVQAARDFELAWLSDSRFLMAEAQAEEIVAIEQNLSLKAASRHEIARIRSRYPRLAVSGLYPRGWVLYDRTRPLDLHCWILEDPSGRAWEEIQVPQRQIRFLGWWQDRMVLLERSSPTNSQVLTVPKTAGSLAASLSLPNRLVATLPVMDYGLLADGDVYLVASGSWQQDLLKLDLASGQTAKMALPTGARTVHKPYALGEKSLSVLLEGPFLPPEVWQFQLEDQLWEPLRSSPLVGLDLDTYRCLVEPQRVVLSKSDSVSENRPVLLESYGAFRQTLPPVYDPVRLEWLRRGGEVVLEQLPSVPLGQEQAISSLHQARKELKGSVVYRGRSFGATLGLMTEIRYPGTFQAIWADAALTDLLHYPSLEPGTLWLAELGDPKESSQGQRLAKISPLTTLTASFPPTVMSSARNDRVVDFRHVWSFVQQAESLGLKTVFLFEQNGGSHGTTGTAWREDLEILDVLWRLVVR